MVEHPQDTEQRVGSLLLPFPFAEGSQGQVGRSPCTEFNYRDRLVLSLGQGILPTRHRLDNGLGVARLHLAAEMRERHGRGRPQQEAARSGCGSQFEGHRVPVVLREALHGGFQR